MGLHDEVLLYEKGQLQTFREISIAWSELVVVAPKRYLVEEVPDERDRRTLNRIIERTPGYRRSMVLTGAASLLDANLMPDRVRWVIGNVPLVVAIGVDQHEGLARPDRSADLVRAANLTRRVEAILVYHETLSLLIFDKDPSRPPQPSGALIRLPKRITLEEVFESKPWLDPG